jgi:hypothetical protein
MEQILCQIAGLARVGSLVLKYEQGQREKNAPVAGASGLAGRRVAQQAFACACESAPLVTANGVTTT